MSARFVDRSSKNERGISSKNLRWLQAVRLQDVRAVHVLVGKSRRPVGRSTASRSLSAPWRVWSLYTHLYTSVKTVLVYKQCFTEDVQTTWRTVNGEQPRRRSLKKRAKPPFTCSAPTKVTRFFMAKRSYVVCWHESTITVRLTQCISVVTSSLFSCATSPESAILESYPEDGLSTWRNLACVMAPAQYGRYRCRSAKRTRSP